jgi:ornithine decarboxylase
MSFQQAIWKTRQDYLGKCKPEIPVAFFDPSALIATAQSFTNGFSGLVTYAVKANPDTQILRCLIASGIDTFDVASPVEIDLIRSINLNATLHYHNPVRSLHEIKYAASKGVKSYSVDRLTELDKLLKHIPAQSEISVRLKLDMAGAAYDFGAKFGADADVCVALLRKVQESGHHTSMTFHPGTQCSDPKTWAVYIEKCAEIAKQADVSLYRLNVGGGFPSHRAHEKPQLEPFFETIKAATDKYFPDSPLALVCEPGRAMAASAYSLAVRVKAVSEDAVFLNDGVYGGLTEFRDIGNVERYSVKSNLETPASDTNQDFIAFGPTCDSLDQLPTPLTLPTNIQEDDYILFENMGAYVSSIATRFNGYGDFDVVAIRED